MRYYTILFSLFIIISGLQSCEKDHLVVGGMAPKYIRSDDFTKIYSTDTMPFIELGNIVKYGNYLLINDKFRGIHVIDNSDPSNPKKVLFWNIPGNTEFTVDGTTLYADNSVHLLIIDISDINQIKVISYIKDYYLNSEPDEPRPPNFRGYFECVDQSKGVHVGWEFKELTDPLCEAY